MHPRSSAVTAFWRALGLDSNICYAARLAAMTDAALVPAYCMRVNDSAWFKVEFLQPVSLVSTGDRKADLFENVRRLDAVITPIVRAHPDQWYFALDLELNS